MRYRSGGRHVHRQGCRHCQVIEEYRDAVFAREALRENGEGMRMEDDEFDEAHPKPRFKDWLIASAEAWREPT